MLPWTWSCMADYKHLRSPIQLMASSSIHIKPTEKFLQGHNFPSGFVLSVICVLLSVSLSSALPLSQQSDPTIITELLPNKEVPAYLLDRNKRSGGGSVNFSPGWGKRSLSSDHINPDEYFYEKRGVNFSPGWGKRSGGSINFSPGWGKRSGGSVNFSPSWGKRSVNFSPSWGKRSGGSVNFSPSWGKRSGGSVNFSPSWGKRSVNFSPSWGKRSGGSVNFSPSWGKRAMEDYQGTKDYFEDSNQEEYDGIGF